MHENPTEKARSAPQATADHLPGTDADLVFLHANAYPPQCYTALLSELHREHRVRLFSQRPLWPGSDPRLIRSWHPLTDDFLRWVDEHASAPIIAVGHSMGATVALRAAIREPGRFRSIVLVEPVILTPAASLGWRLRCCLPFGHPLHNAIRQAGRRRRMFPDEAALFRAYRRHSIFRRVSDDDLRAVARGLTMETADGLELRYTPAWEERIYRTAIWNDRDLWHGLPLVRVPTLIVRGAESNTLRADTCARIRRCNAKIEVIEIPQTTHLLPFEKPEELARRASTFLHRPGFVGDMTA